MKCFLGLLTMACLVGAQAPADEDIRKIISQRVDNKQATGIVAGVISPEGRRYVAYGTLATGDKRKLDENTVFEIGSISKVFTSLLLADMVQRGQVALTDPVAKYLPEGVKVPERGGKQITFLDLSTHMSGLPRIPTNMPMEDPGNPYVDYTSELLYSFLASYSLPRDIGAQFEYSNLGGGLLGHVLTLRAGMSYEDLVKARITGPLGMKDTSIALTPSMKDRLAVGHNGKLQPVENWDFSVLAGAGALRSTASDLLTFLSAFLEMKESPLASAMKSMTASTHRAQGAMKIGLAWLITPGPGPEIFMHDGGTGGFRSFVGFDAKTRVGAVVLANAGTQVGVVDIGMHLLNPAAPVLNPQPPKEHKEVSIDSKLLDRYIGTYNFGPIQIVVTREKNRLFSQVTGQPRTELFAEGPRDFFLKVADAQVTFEDDGEDKAPAMVLHQLGRDQRAPRLPSAPFSLEEPRFP